MANHDQCDAIREGQGQRGNFLQGASHTSYSAVPGRFSSFPRYIRCFSASMCLHTSHTLVSCVAVCCRSSSPLQGPAEMPHSQGSFPFSPFVIHLSPAFRYLMNLSGCHFHQVISFLITKPMSHSSWSLLGRHSLFYNESKPLWVTFEVLLGRLLPASSSVPPLHPVLWPNQTNYGSPNVPCS